MEEMDIYVCVQNRYDSRLEHAVDIENYERNNASRIENETETFRICE